VPFAAGHSGFDMMSRRSIFFLFALTAMVIQMPTSSQNVLAQQSFDDKRAVRQAVDQWFVVLNAMLNGDPKPFAELYSHADDVTYMGAEGTYRVGWKATYADWTAQAKKGSGGKVTGSKIHIVVSGTMAAAQHYTKGDVRMPDGKTVNSLVRETSVFRKEDGAWKMISHHADGLPDWEQAFEKK
jgi:uncharacterized protein (TIGR02246 family)